MSVISLKSIEDGFRYAFTTRERPKPVEPAKQNLWHLTLVGTVNMEHSLMAHPGKAAIDQSTLPALHAVPKTDLQAWNEPAEQEPEQTSGNVVNMAARRAIKDAGIEQTAQPEREQLATVHNLHYRGSDLVMDATVDAVDAGRPMLQPEELEQAS